LDKFPEAFERFEKRVDVSRIRSFEQLTLAFSIWAGKQWKGTSKQVKALKIEAVKRGIPVPKEKPKRKEEVGLRFRQEEVVRLEVGGLNGSRLRVILRSVTEI
jgi:hypothetical protein